jgi:hypothetical protein
MLEDLERTIQILHIDIWTEEERVRVFDKADPLYSVLARTLTSPARQPDRHGRRTWETPPRYHSGTPRFHLRGGLINNGRGTEAPP